MLLRKTWVLAALLALAAVPTDATPAAARSAHADMACRDCHAAPEPITADNAGALVDRQESLCGRCHGGAVEASHPSGFAPQRSLPTGFPLDKFGRVTCNTCHVPHSDSATHLRAGGGEDFCLACHDASFFQRMADGGLSLQSLGHLSARPQPESRVDGYSLQCMVCHASNASIKGDVATDQANWSNTGGSVNHPIGSEYDKVAMRGGYWPKSRLPSEMVLPGGRVGCVSCHVGYGERHGGLLRPDRLCFDCHDK